MSDISRKALEDTLNTLYNQPMAAGAYRAAINDVKAEIAGIPSTEPEGEADQYDLQMTAELGRLARENGRLRAALEHLLSKAAIKGDFTTVHYINNSLSPHREDAGTGIQLRSTVEWFSEQMELVLRVNDHKGGWENESLEWLRDRLFKNLRDLETSIKNVRAWQDNGGLSDREINRLVKDCADVANRALMIADNARSLIKDGRDTDT